MGIKNKEIFKYHYNLEVGNNRCPCGPGSRPDFLIYTGTIDYINRIIDDYNIKSINDCPSGVFGNWAYLLKLSDVKYVGYDINDLVVDRNKKEYPDLEFHELDLVNENVPYADLILCKDCLFHLSNAFVFKVLDNFKKSGSKYLLTTNYDKLSRNKELSSAELAREAGFKEINLIIDPFNMGLPIETHTEKINEFFGVENDHELSLWQLN